MKYTIVSAHTGIHGSLLNLLDLNDYLIRHGHEVDFICLDRFHLMDKIQQTMRIYKPMNVYDLETLEFPGGIKTQGNVIRRGEVIITDFKSLISWPKSISCKKLVILDNAELSYHLNGTTIDFYPKDIDSLYTVLNRHKFQEHVFCMPPSNLTVFKERYPDLNAVEFYKKINIEALASIKTDTNNKFFYRGENPPEDIAEYNDLLVDLTQMFNYSGYIYYRRRDRAAYEQFGRMVFEFIILDKRIEFYDHPTGEPDGLKDYWNHYGKGVREKIIEMMLEDYREPPWE